MQLPPLMIGGIELDLHAGAVEHADEEIGGEVSVRMSLGTLVTMLHWKKAAGVISAQGWMPPGLDGLDFSQPIELRSTQVSTVQGAGLVHQLSSTPRPDMAPWAFALVGGHWVETACVTVDRTATVEAVTGATAYQVWWLPVFQVKAQRPPKAQSSASASHSWSMPWQEV